MSAGCENCKKLEREWAELIHLLSDKPIRNGNGDLANPACRSLVQIGHPNASKIQDIVDREALK